MTKKVGQRTLKATTTAKIDGKLQPQAIELEQAVLGALMIDNESLSDAIDSLQAEYFYAPKRHHQQRHALQYGQIAASQLSLPKLHNLQ